VIAADRAALDSRRCRRDRRRVRAAKPALIVNAGAYTAVDRAESEVALGGRSERPRAGHPR
jgi:dTDP-4-dehydrorhamnose reductase